MVFKRSAQAPALLALSAACCRKLPGTTAVHMRIGTRLPQQHRRRCACDAAEIAASDDRSRYCLDALIHI